MGTIRSSSAEIELLEPRGRAVELAPSNHQMYDDRSVTFPGLATNGAISHVHVDYIPTSDGQGDSFGVITMGIKHANRIQGALDRELNGNSELSEFFDTGRQERFFVKKLERVQEDERDVIIISVGYGKTGREISRCASARSYPPAAEGV